MRRHNLETNQIHPETKGTQDHDNKETRHLARHPKCPQAVKEAVQRIGTRCVRRKLHGNMANHNYKMWA